MRLVRTSLRLSLMILTATLSLALFSCDDEDSEPKAPVITSFTPLSGVPGTNVTIVGNNFSTTPSDNQVEFNGVAATIASATATQLVATVPNAATTGKITVMVNGATAMSATDFTVLETTITSFTPASGIVGTTVTIAGTNFSVIPTENIVKFNGTDAIVSAATATQLTVSVPAAATTGKISVSLNGKTTTSVNDFTVPAPTITGYSPSIAASGISVKITGINFSAITTNNVVKFNGVNAIVTAASQTELTVTVPASITTGALTVTVGPHTATASGDFEICTGSAELVLSEIVVTNTSGSTSYNVSFKITNVGATNADLSKMGMQNYASQDNVFGGGDVAASGFSLTSAPTITPGESYTTGNFSCSIVGGNTTSHPFLVITLYDAPDGAIPECNTDNNIVIKPFN